MGWSEWKENVWKMRPGTSLAGELMKTLVLDREQISTSVMLAVVTDSQTLRMLLSSL